MELIPRDYQSEAVNNLLRSLQQKRNPLVKLPTGSGKSLVLALAVAHLYRATGAQQLVVSHVKELLEQDSKTLRRVDPSIPQGYFCAGLGEKRPRAAIVFASVQTASRALDELGQRSYMHIDEAHLCPRDSDAMYAKTFNHFSLALRCGYTATDQRLDSGKLTEGEAPWFDELAIDVPVGDLIKRGFLVPLSGVLTEHQADLDGVATRMGDFVAEQAESAVTRTLSLSDVVSDVLRLAKRRKHWLIYAAGVAHAEQVYVQLRSAGVNAAVLTGETASGKRDEIIDQFRGGELKALVNVGVLTTGFDAPQTDAIICLRPTKSPVLWTQILGRGMRPALSKENCLLLDFVGNLERLGGAGCVVEIKDERSEETRAPSKRKKFTRDDPTFVEASLADPMKSGQSFEARVERVRYFLVPSRRHQGKSLVVVNYDLEDQYGRALQAKSFVAVEYFGAARYLAIQWFARRGFADSEQIPHHARTALALAQTLPNPSEVRVYWDPRMRCYLIMEERFEASA